MYEHYHMSSHAPEPKAPALRNTNTKIVKARRAWYFFLTSDIKGRKGGERITRGRTQRLKKSEGTGHLTAHIIYWGHALGASILHTVNIEHRWTTHKMFSCSENFGPFPNSVMFTRENTRLSPTSDVHVQEGRSLGTRLPFELSERFQPSAKAHAVITSMGWLLARESRLMALAYSRLRKLVHISNSGWVWSTERYSIQVANPSLSHRWVHHSIVT